MRWLWKMRPARGNCLFVVVPDVVGDARATTLRYLLLFLPIQLLGFPTALAAQDGAERWPWSLAVRWLPYDALFVGGSTGWKLSPAADACIRTAQARGKWVHVGRVNSQRRIRHFQRIGVDSVDGTSLAFAPNRDFWRFQKVLLQKPLFTIGAKNENC